jgi:hypothetical protein
LIGGVRFPVWARDIPLLHNVQFDFGAHPATYPTVLGALSPGVKRPRREADHSPAPSTEVKDCGAVLPLPNTSRLLGMVLNYLS